MTPLYRERLDARTDLRADCSACLALCCVALDLSRSSDFPVDKPAGTPCGHLDATMCGIHDRLRPSGYAGCVAYDCYGAGQRITALHPGRSWRTDPAAAGTMFALLPRLRHVHELLRLLLEAAELGFPSAALDRAIERSEQLARALPAEILAADAGAHHDSVVAVLRDVSDEVRAAHAGDRAPSDLAGADLVGADLRWADLTGADLRGARLHGADLSQTLFCSQAQLEAATGDALTKIPGRLRRPAHWTAAR